MWNQSGNYFETFKADDVDLIEQPPVPTRKRKVYDAETVQFVEGKEGEISDEYDDYLSDSFLNKVADTDNDRDQRRGKSYQEMRRDAIRDSERKQKEEMWMNRKDREEITRQRGLETEIPESNVGFSLLKKMGYSAGMPLGKAAADVIEDSEAAETVQPIPVVVRKGRIGLGEPSIPQDRGKNEIYDKQEEQQEVAEKGFEGNKIKYQQQMIDANQRRKLINDLRQGLRACEQLDEKAGFGFFESLIGELASRSNSAVEDGTVAGTESNYKSSSVTSLTDELSLEESKRFMQRLVDYLRSTHTYCQWCAVKYESVEDLAENCPGPLSELH